METRVIETPVNKVRVELKAWLTGADKRKIAQVQDNPAKVQDEMLRMTVLKVGEHSDPNTIMAELDKMHGKDFDTVVMEILKISEDSSVSPEKKSA